MAPYAFNTTTSMTLGVRRLLKYTVVALATTASAPTLALAATSSSTTAESTWSVVRSVVEELPAGVQFWSLGDKETTFERPAPVVLDEHVLGDLRSEFNFMQDFPASVDESTTFDSTSRSFVAAIPHGHVQGGSGLVFDDAGRVFHEKNQQWERNNAKPPMPIATSSQKHYKLLATTIQKYGHMYFHFMLETLQKFVMLKPHMDAHPEMKILSWGSAWESAFLKKLGIDESRVVKYEPYVENGSDIPGVVDYSADALLMPTPSMRITPSREGLQLTRKALGVKAAPVDQRNLVIYATRKAETSRRVGNEAEVLAALERAVEGTKYEVVVFEGMADNLDETIELFSHAAVIVGPHGAGLSHLLFAPEGTKIVEFQFVRDPPMMFWSAAAALNQKYYLLPVPDSYWLQEEMDVPAEDVYELVSLALGGSRETASSDCPAGTYSTSNKCLPCAAGRYSAGGNVACRTCLPNTFAHEGMSECTACPAGTVAWLPGSKSVGDCMSPKQHFNMLSNIEDNLMKLNKLSPVHFEAARRALIEMEQGEGYFQTMVEGDGDAETTAPASMPTILDPRIASIAVEGGMEDYVPVVPGQMHLAVGDPGPGASALCRLQRIAEASGGWDAYGGATLASTGRDFCRDPVSAYSAEVIAFSGPNTPTMGYIEDMSCPSGFAEMDTSSRSGFRCVACDLVRILPLAECGTDGADEAKCCSGLAEWIWAGCLCDSNGVNLATSLGATEELALEGASACGFTMSSIPRPSARTCVQNITDELRMEQEQSSGAKAAATSLVAMIAVFVASQV